MLTSELGTVIITGAASGLGAATARAVKDAGGTPVSLDLRVPEIDIEHELVDVADTDATRSAIHRVTARLGLDAIVTCAGTDACGRLEEVPPNRWEQVIGVNLLGTAAAVRAALPHLARSGGKVVTVASTLGLRAMGDATAYCASKFGVVGFTRALAAETAGQVGVTLLIAGGMHTAFFDGREERYRPAPEAKLNRPQDVAAAILFALQQPAGCEIREMVVAPSMETSWP